MQARFVRIIAIVAGAWLVALAVIAGVRACRPSTPIAERPTEPFADDAVDTLRPLRTMNASGGRTGVYFLPRGFRDGHRPVLVALHGTGGDGPSIAGAFLELARSRRFILIAPESGRAPTGEFTWQVADKPNDVSDDRRHVMNALAEVESLPGVRVDASHVLIVGHSGGGSSAPYIATNEAPFSAFAISHGGAFVGGLGGHRLHGWASTGQTDSIRPPNMVNQAAEALTLAGFPTEFHVFAGGHGLGADEARAIVAWWLRDGT